MVPENETFPPLQEVPLNEILFPKEVLFLYEN